MDNTDWNAQAVRAADYVRSHLNEARRGVILWHNGLLIAFGNESYQPGDIAQQTVRLLRNYLVSNEAGAFELGFGVVGQPDAWAMILRPYPDASPDAVRDGLDAVVWEAFNVAEGREPHDRFGHDRERAAIAILRELLGPVEEADD